jgi:hypothetical protein
MYLGDNLMKQPVKTLVRRFEDEKANCVIGYTEFPTRNGSALWRCMTERSSGWWRSH